MKASIQGTELARPRVFDSLDSLTIPGVRHLLPSCSMLYFGNTKRARVRESSWVRQEFVGSVAVALAALQGKEGRS